MLCDCGITFVSSLIVLPMFALDLFSCRRSSFRCLGNTVLPDCGITWVASLIFLSMFAVDMFSFPSFYVDQGKLCYLLVALPGHLRSYFLQMFPLDLFFRYPGKTF